MSKYLDETGVKYLHNKITAEIGEAVSGLEDKISSVYNFKGTVDDLVALKALPEEGLKVGDTYNVKASGMNYAWTGQKESPEYDDGWDALGGLIEIPTLTTEDIDRILSEG